jgi:peroxiredoxin
MKINNIIFRSLYLTGIISTILLSGCSKNENRFTIKGQITHGSGKSVYLEELLVSSTKPVDSTKIDKKGKFEFEGETGVPTYFLLKLTDRKFITLLVDSMEEITIEADIANFERDYRVSGSVGSAQVKELNDRLYETRHKLDSLKSLDNLYKGNPDYPELSRQWQEEEKKIRQEQIEFSKQFVNNNPFSMASVMALYQKFDNDTYVLNDLHTMRVAASALNSIYPESGHVKVLYQNTLQLLKEEENAKIQRFIQEQGENSPDIVLPDPDGREIALSSLRGKVVLLHFWSAVDKDSRILNQALVEAYRKYNNKGFEIYQVSVDDNRIEWVDAIDTDRLTWINVGDMEGSTQAVNLYNIKSVPYNYLLNREGIIMAKNLKGPALDRELDSVCN